MINRTLRWGDAMDDTKEGYALEQVRRWLLGSVATSKTAKVSISPTGTLTIDRDELHNSPAYLHQIEALKELERMINSKAGSNK